jgi:pimeloyl-ACP methyl ester carboxylesterase
LQGSGVFKIRQKRAVWQQKNFLLKNFAYGKHTHFPRLQGLKIENSKLLGENVMLPKIARVVLLLVLVSPLGWLILLKTKTRPIGQCGESETRLSLRLRHICFLFLALLTVLLHTASAQGQNLYPLKVIARTGDAGLVSIAPEVSINRSGNVAFVGKVSDPGNPGMLAENVFIGNENLSVPRNISPILNSADSQTLIPGVQLNDQNLALVRRRIRLPTPLGIANFTYLETWSANTINGQNILVQAAYPFTEFDGLYSHPSFNNQGGMVFMALFRDINQLATLTSAGAFKITLTGELRRPMLADNNTFVLRSGAAPYSIQLREPAFALTKTIAGADNGFSTSNIGFAPAISDDGKIVAFYGEPVASTPDTAGLNNGPGIFVAIRNNNAWVYRRVAGLRHNQVLDPGETYIDVNGNGQFDPGLEIDEGPFSGFLGNERLGVSNTGQVVFLATDANGRKGIYTGQVVQNGADFPSNGANLIAAQQSILGFVVSSPVVDLALYDPISNGAAPQIAFWAKLADGTETVIAADLSTPLIFVPGIAGSYLADQAEPLNRLWLDRGALFGDLRRLSLLHPFPGIIATDAANEFFGDEKVGYLRLRQRLTAEGYREYEVAGNPNRRTESGCDVAQRDNKPNLFVFGYDWRRDSRENAVLLKSYVKCVQRFYPHTKVNILAHSMGGLLARRYILQNNADGDSDGYPDHDVIKLITIGSPWLGAPKANITLETGFFFDISYADSFLGGDIKDLSEYFPGVHQLLPSKAYFDLGGRPYQEVDWDADGDGIPQPGGSPQTVAPYDYPQFRRMLDRRFPGTRQIVANSDALHALPTQDNWQNDTTQVHYHHIYGITGIDHTIIQTQTVNQCYVFSAGTACNSVIRAVDNGRGDNTVPILSAHRLGIGPGGELRDYNAPNARFYIFDGVAANDNVPPENWADHTGLCSNPRVQDRILAILRSPAETPGPASPYPIAAESEQPSAPQAAYYVGLTNATTFRIADANGNNSDPTPTMPFGRSVPGVSFHVLGPDSINVAFPAQQTYRVTFRAGARPMVIALTKGSSEGFTEAIRYRDLVLPANVNALLQFTPQGAENLKYDADGDGTFETTVTPTASVSGVAAQDTEGPIVTFNGTAQQGNVQVSISAADSGSGVRQIFYSLNGTNFQPYTAPFTVNPNQTQAVYAFADDNVANRSGLATFYPSLTTNAIDNSQFFVRQHYLDFLDREPDAAGLAYWTGQLTNCGNDANCLRARRIGVSAAFFIELEFQETGSFVYRFYKASLGRIPNYADFSADRRRVIGGADLEASRQAFAADWVERPEFLQRYPGNLSGAQFIDALLATVQQNSGVNLSSLRDMLLADFAQYGNRARIVRLVADAQAFQQTEYNRAFVMMQYYGYLRRDFDQAGYDFWLDVVTNREPGNYRGMVCAFITSAEYQLRFGSVVSRTNAECVQP